MNGKQRLEVEKLPLLNTLKSLIPFRNLSAFDCNDCPQPSTDATLAYQTSCKLMVSSVPNAFTWPFTFQCWGLFIHFKSCDSTYEITYNIEDSLQFQCASLRIDIVHTTKYWWSHHTYEKCLLQLQTLTLPLSKGDIFSKSSYHGVSQHGNHNGSTHLWEKTQFITDSLNVIASWSPSTWCSPWLLSCVK